MNNQRVDGDPKQSRPYSFDRTQTQHNKQLDTTQKHKTVGEAKATHNLNRILQHRISKKDDENRLDQRKQEDLNGKRRDATMETRPAAGGWRKPRWCGEQLSSHHQSLDLHLGLVVGLERGRRCGGLRLLCKG